MAEQGSERYGRERDYEGNVGRGSQRGGSGRESERGGQRGGGYGETGHGREGSERWSEQGGYGGGYGHEGGESSGQGGYRGGYDRDSSERWGQQGFRGPYAGHGPKGYQRSDDRIKEDVCEALTQHGDVDASEIDVMVQNGEVTLTGTVDSRRAKRMAEDAVESASGVKEIHNQLRVKESGQRTTMGHGSPGTQEPPRGNRAA